MKRIIKTVLIINCLGLLSCSNEGEMEHGNTKANDTVKINSQVSQEVLDEMMQSLPQPIEIAQIITTSKIEINKDLLIPSSNVDNLDDKYSQALSFGGYGVDLGYINLSDKTAYMIEYLGSVKKVSEKLKVDQFFDFETLSKLAKNKNNTDSLVQISTENFNKIDEYLREQNRGEQSVLILIGAWLEGMNMFGEIYNSTKSEDISKRIGEQKIVFDNVYLILEKLNQIEYFKNMKDGFTPLRAAYDKIKITYIYKKPVMKEVNGQLVLKDQTEMKVDCSEKELIEVVSELQQVRNKYFLAK